MRIERLKEAALDILFGVGLAVVGLIGIPIAVLLGIVYSLLEFVGNSDDE